MNAYLNILQELAIMKGARWDSGPKKITIIIIIMVIRKAEQLFNKSWWMGFFISEEKTFSM
jgi:hypothetical protein